MAVEKKINEIINRLEKTKEEKYPDLAAEKESRDREDRNEKKAQIQEIKKKEKEEMKRKKEQEELRYHRDQTVSRQKILYLKSHTHKKFILRIKFAA